jgi:hypothetical protein
MTTYYLKKKKMNRFLKYRGKWMMIRKKRTGNCQLCDAGTVKGRGKDVNVKQTIQTQFHQIIDDDKPENFMIELCASCLAFETRRLKNKY